jgi:hypothetical protein
VFFSFFFLSLSSARTVPQTLTRYLRTFLHLHKTFSRKLFCDEIPFFVGTTHDHTVRLPRDLFHGKNHESRIDESGGILRRDHFDDLLLAGVPAFPTQDLLC